MWDQLSRTITLSDGTRQLLSGYLDGPASNSDPDAADLYEFRAAVATLAGVSSAEALERNLRQAIDSTSHRLDVWITSVAHGRLTSLRRSNPSGVLIGGYGWVENLRLRSSSLESDGFIHAPSVPQAVSAAVLRSGYQSTLRLCEQPVRGQPQLGPLAPGQPAARWGPSRQTVGALTGYEFALTGYEFERNIQESGAGQYTRAFRECAPSSTTFPAGGGPPATIPQPPRLTDGLVLRDKWEAGDSQVAALLAQIESDDQ